MCDHSAICEKQLIRSCESLFNFVFVCEFNTAEDGHIFGDTCLKKTFSKPLALNHPQIWAYSNPQKKIEQVNHHHFCYNQPQTVGVV